MTNNSHHKFFRMIEKVPRVSHMWDKNKLELDVELFERELCVMSRGEILISKFFAAVWFNNNSRYGFDVVDVVARIDSEFRNIIIDWMKNPFWP